MANPKQRSVIEKLEFTGTVTGTIPTATSATGTFGSAGVVVTGTSTSFLDEVLVSDYLYSETLNELRKIDSVYNDTTLFVESAFTVGVSGDAFKFARTEYTSVAITNNGSTAAGIDGGTIESGEVETYNAEWGLDPFIFATSGNTLKFDLIR